VQLSAFEEMNRVRIEICLHHSTLNDLADITVTAKAWERGAERREAKPLGLVSVTWRAEGFKSLEGLITFLLYQLDFQLARGEFDAVKPNSA